MGEDQPNVREGIVHVLQDGGFEVVATAGNAQELVDKARALPSRRGGDRYPDATGPHRRRPSAVRKIRASQPEVGVLVLSQFLEDSYAFDLVGGDALGVGYLLKEKVGDLRMFADAVPSVAAGGSALDSDVVARLIGRPRRNSRLIT